MAARGEAQRLTPRRQAQGDARSGGGGNVGSPAGALRRSDTGATRDTRSQAQLSFGPASGGPSARATIHRVTRPKPQVSPFALGQFAPFGDGAASGAEATQDDGPTASEQELRTAVMTHPLYPRLLEAITDCHKVRAALSCARAHAPQEGKPAAPRARPPTPHTACARPQAGETDKAVLRNLDSTYTNALLDVERLREEVGADVESDEDLDAFMVRRICSGPQGLRSRGTAVHTDCAWAARAHVCRRRTSR